MEKYWRDGILGVVTGDALGCPVQFMQREDLKLSPVETMEGHGTFDMPEGTWTDDSSLTLALLASLKEKKKIDLPDIMARFADWLMNGAYTPFGESFDIGNGTMNAVMSYVHGGAPETAGGTGERNNGNGSLMRILPACIFCVEQQAAGMPDEEAVQTIHAVSALTHGHLRAKIGCGLYYFLVRAVMNGTGDLGERLQKGIGDGFAYYRRPETLAELSHYGRLRDLKAFSLLPEEEIRSSGYVVHTLEAAVWCLLQERDYAGTLLRAVNLADDADTVGAVCGGLAGLFYGADGIPEEWLSVLQRKDWLEEMLAG